ncbi:TonB-dependent receptor [Shewanella sp. D64]|uniref:TonB-dependent receptor plug domain-containing protein n=1 Tax=unclassified Shewanella TaxID=196818 RepID=UPI0022BA1D5C|nr:MULTISPECIES: TonB-dependent receptor [unclassified Shewanella]MEC4726018.1 TonB-dependent receptor [Shewanella sp. D64]MEC4737273.1 TonB-dependent receptor [Shewanella sp. E94]WBJ93650.1 TonB-dependent receptor [Shewanella sp. MTB7]
MFNNNLIAKSVRLAIIGGITAATFTSSTAFAVDEEATDKVERIEVTGSRIKRTEIEATSPIITISEAQIEITGANNVATFINELPSAGIPGTTDTASNFRTSTTGISTVDLRNLGSNRTLILVNGRRHIGGSAGSPTVDVSMIPIDLVKRVEVVTGGASAVYGSEAIAGVINFIMKDEFEGIEFNSRFGDSSDGGGEEKDFTVTLGGNFAEDKGNAVVHVGYSDKSVLRSSDRDISAHDAVNSTFGPKGNFFVPGQGIITQDDTTGLWDKPFVAAEDGFDRNAVRLIRVPTERVQLNANIKYDLNEHVNFFSESAYSQLTSSSQLEPTIVGRFISVGNSIPNITIPINNYFVPTELRNAVLAGDPDATDFDMYRRFVELGPRSSDVDRKVFRTAFGVEGAINDNWDYNAYYQYGSFSQSQTNGGVFNTLNFYNSLQTELDADGKVQCADSFARDLGCVPVDVFGAGAISGDALDWVSVDSQLTSTMKQQVFGASITGVAFELPAGDLGVAFGYEWRSEESKFNSDALAQSGLTSGNTTPNTKGDYDVSEYFMEVNIPILSDLPLAQYVGLELAYRYSDYSTIGGASTYKVALDWSPFDDLKIRGGVSTAVRAPNIGELFDPGSETFRSFVDPCALGGKGGTSATGEVYQVQSAAVQANCAQIPGSATLDPFALNIRSAGGLSAGNPDLKEETSKAKTVGFVYSPSQVEGLSFTVDYFKINIEDAINDFGAQTTVDQCVRQPDYPNNPFCDLIKRDPTTGLVDRINALAINVADFEVSGIDFTADYRFELPVGDLDLGLIGTYSLSNDFVPFTGGEVVDSQGEIGAPDLKANFNIIYSLEDLKLAWTVRYIEGVNVENDSVEAFGTLPTYVYHNMQARYHFNDNLELYAGANNVFDKKPPFLGQGVPGDATGTNTASDVYDVFGRYYYGGIKVKF